MFRQIAFQNLLLIRTHQFFRAADGCYGNCSLEIGGPVAAVVDHDGNPVMGFEIGKFTGGPRCGEVNVFQIIRRIKGHQAGIRLTIALGRQSGQFLRSKKCFYAFADLIFRFHCCIKL